MVGFIKKCCVLRFNLSTLFCLMAVLVVSPATHAWKMESGKLVLPATSSSTSLHTFSFQQSYDAPPVVIALPTTAGSDASAIRINNITTTGFQMAQVEPKSEDGPHAAMTVSYIAIESGSHTLPDGSVIEAGSLSTDSTQYNGIPPGGKDWDSISYTGFSNPSVVAAIQSTNNEPTLNPRNSSHPWLTVAVNNVTATTADIALERSEVYDSTSGPNFRFDSLGSSETIGYVVMESGRQSSFRASGNQLVSFETIYRSNGADGWSNGCDSINFVGSYSAAPLVVATKSTRREADGGWLRECSVNSSAIQLTIDEDDDQDNERSHVQEDVSLLVFSAAFIYDSNAVGPQLSDSLILEADEVVLASGSNIGVTFRQVYDQPPAVFILGDNNNPEPSSVRISNVTNTGFTVAPFEPPSLYVDIADQPTTIHYLAISYGQHEFPNGTQVEVISLPMQNYQSKFLSGSSWRSISYYSSFSSTPVVFSQIQSTANETSGPAGRSVPWMTSTQRNVDSSGFNLSLDRAETSNGSITVDETVAYLAIEAGVIADYIDIEGNQIKSEALTTPDNIAGSTSCYTANFLQSYSGSPLVVGSQSTRDGGDGGWLRRCTSGSNSATLKIEEDWASDRDNSHTTERASFMVFSQPFAADFSSVGFWSMEESSWSGNAGEVINTSNLTGADGIGVSATTKVTTPAIPGTPGTCRYGEFDGVSGYVDVPHNDQLNGDDALTYMAWVRPDAWSGTQQIMAKSVHGGGAGRAQMGVFSEGSVLKGRAESAGGTYEVSTSLPATGIWTHVALVFNGDSLSLYINGTLANTNNFGATTLLTNSDPLHISKRVGSSQYFFDGLIDEVRVFSRALPATAIAYYRDFGRPCSAPVIDHYEITVTSPSLTCEGSPVEIAVHDAGHNPVVPSAGTTINISASLTSAEWAVDPATLPPGNFVPGANGTASYTFAGTENSVTLYLHQITEATVNVDLTDGAVSESPSEDPSINFVDTALVFDGDTTTGALEHISAQIAGKSSSVLLRAVQKNTSTGACEARLTGIQTIDFAFECETPSSCKQYNGARINGAGISGNDSGSAVSYKSVSVDFGLNGTAAIDLAYSDAGQIKLHAEKTIAASGADPEITLTGESNLFVVSPAGFCVAAPVGGACGAPYHSCSGFKKAGEAFELKISAVTWEADGESNTGFCSGIHSVTPNFELSNAVLSHDLKGPTVLSGGTLGTLGVISTSFTSANNGEVTIANQTVSETGAFDFTLDLSAVSYLGEPLQSSTSEITGRFYPAYFSVTGNTPSVRNGQDQDPSPADSWSCGFTYQDQPFEYSISPQLTVVAKNSSGATTNNYDGDYWKLNDLQDQRSYIDNAFKGPTLTEDLTSANVIYDKGTGYDGSAVLTIEGDYFNYQKTNFTPAADDAAFSSDMNLELKQGDLTDATDGVCFQNDAASSCRSFVFNNILGADIRYGRAVMENAFGPEDTNLTLPLRVEYWTGSQFAVNVADSCTGYSSAEAPPIVLSGYTDNLNAAETEAQIAGVAGAEDTFSFGQYPGGRAIYLTAPGIGNDGSVSILHQFDDWLKYDWNEDGDISDTVDHPSATATFGRYRGHDRIIYWREVSR